MDRGRPCFRAGKSWELRQDKGRGRSTEPGGRDAGLSIPGSWVSPWSSLDLIPFWYKKEQDRRFLYVLPPLKAPLHMLPHQPRRQEADGGMRFRVARRQQPSRLALHYGSLPGARCLDFTAIVPQPQGTRVKPCMHVTHFVSVPIRI